MWALNKSVRILRLPFGLLQFISGSPVNGLQAFSKNCVSKQRELSNSHQALYLLTGLWSWSDQHLAFIGILKLSDSFNHILKDNRPSGAKGRIR